MNATKQGGTMKELAFRYDIETDDWIECQSEMFVHEDIEKLPCAIYLDFKGVLVQTEKVLLNKGKGLFPWLHSDKGMPILPSGERIDAFANKWEDDSENICRSLKTIKEYYAFYCVTLNNSSPTSYNKDARYVIDSLKTSKLALSVKLRKIEENIK
jgi:hypothetical protein